MAACISPASVDYNSRPGLVLLVLAALFYSLSSTLSSLQAQHYAPSVSSIAVLQGASAVGYLGAATTVVGLRPLPRRWLLGQTVLAVAGNAVPLVISNWTGLLIGRFLLGLSSPFPLAIRFLSHSVVINTKQSYWLCILTGNTLGLLLSFPLSLAVSSLSLCLGLCSGCWIFLSGCVYVYFPQPGLEEPLDISPFVQSSWSPWLAGGTVAVCRMAMEAFITLSPIVFVQAFHWDNWLIAILMASSQALNLYIFLLIYASNSLLPTLTKAIFALVAGSLAACCCSSSVPIVISAVLICISGPLSDLGAFAYFSTMYPKSEGRWLVVGQLGAVLGDFLVWFYLGRPEKAWPNVFLPIFLLSLAVTGLLSLRSLLPRHNYNDIN